MDEQQLLKYREKMGELMAGETDDERSIANLVRMLTAESDKRIIDGLVALLEETGKVVECIYCGV